MSRQEEGYTNPVYYPKVLSGITIDSPSTRDIDDGIWVEKLPTEKLSYRLTVAIADVSKHIRKGSSLDSLAMQKVTSRYFAEGRNDPMLPRRLSEDKMSLLPGKSRGTLVARILIETDAQTSGGLSYSFEPKLESLTAEKFKSQGRVDYPEIPGILAVNQLRPEGEHLANIAECLLERRRKAGGLAFYDLSQGWVTTEEGFVKQMKDTRETIGYIIVQEAMILTNSLVAEWCVKEDIPVLYRNHTARTAAPSGSEVNEQIKAAMAGPWQEMENFRKRLHMLLDRADYGPTLKGHYGLSLPAYLHFTSPIRRYADLVNHRQIRAKLSGKDLPYTQEELTVIAQHINEHDRILREKESASYKTKAEEKAERALERGKLSRLNDKEFERVLKVTRKSGEDAPDALVQEYLDRLSVDAVPHICMTVVMFFNPETPVDHPGWRKIHEATLKRLQEKPEDAVTLFTIAQSIAEEPAVDYVEQRSGPPHAPVFQARAKFWLHGTAWVNGKTVKQARQRAAVTLLSVVHGFPPPVFPDVVQATPEPEKKPSLLKPLAEGRDPIVALMEYSQKNRLSPPQFEYEQAGPSHIPTITCTCSFNGRTGVGRATSKQEAKRRAAQDLIDKLLQETSFRYANGD